MGVDSGVTVAEVTGAQQRSWSWALEPRIEGCAGGSGGKGEERGKREEKNTCTKTKAKIIICIDKMKLELKVMTH